MNILMLTNIYTPQVGGITNSVRQFTDQYRKRGHRVLIIAPDYDQRPTDEQDVLRISAIPDFYQKRYPLPLPILSTLLSDVAEFKPDVVHTHHPFLLGSTGQAIATQHEVPCVYTHHTRYSKYIEDRTNWPPAIEEAMIELAINYCNLCDMVIAPSLGIQDLLRKAGVTQPISVIPTGVDVARFNNGDGGKLRAKHGIPESAFVAGHIGRLAPEKNCTFLSQCLAEFLKQNKSSYAMVVGDGNQRSKMEQVFRDQAVSDRVVWTGELSGSDVVDAYHAMDAFTFASHTETQGMVLTEAMAAGVPVVAVEGTGVRDLINHQVNGWMIPRDDVEQFVACLNELKNLSDEQRENLRQEIGSTVDRFSLEACADQALATYQQVIDRHSENLRLGQQPAWRASIRAWDAMWRRWLGRAKAVSSAVENFLASDSDSPQI